MADNFEGWRVTALCRPKYSFGHNLRLPEYVENQKHIDNTREHKVFLHFGDEREAYEKVFGDSIKKYNSKQKRKDRRISDYYQKVLEDARKGCHKNPKADSDRKPFYEFQFYIGNRASHCPDEKAKKVLSLYIQKILPKRFPNFIPTSITMHNDEYSYDRKGNRIESPAHFHVVGIFVAHALSAEELKEENEFRAKAKEAKKAELAEKGIKWDEEEWKKKDWRTDMIDRWGKSLEKGMELQCSMSAACNEMGFFTSKGKGTAQQQFEEAVRHDLMDFCEEMGIKINRTKGYKHSHKDKDIYKTEQDNLSREAELAEEKAVLDAKTIDLENQKDDFDYTIEHLEEIENNLTSQQNELEKIKDELSKKEAELNFREERLDNKAQDIQKKERELDSKQREQFAKDSELSRKERKLDSKENQLAEKEELLQEREIIVQQGEEPLIKREKELAQRELIIEVRENVVLEKVQDIRSLLEEVKERENNAIQKENSAIEKAHKAKAELEKAEIDKMEAKVIRDETEKLSSKTQEFIDSFNVDYQEKQLKIQSWTEASEQIENSDTWIKSALSEYKNNRFKENALQNLFQKIKNGVTAAIVKIKQGYDKKIKELTEQLFGFNRFKEYNNGNDIWEYKYGEKDFADMLRDTPIENIQNAIDDTKRKGKNTFGEAAALEDNCYSFYERHFTKAKELTIERNREIKRSLSMTRS